MDTFNKELSKLSFTLHWYPLLNKTYLDSFVVFYSNHSLIGQKTQFKRQQLIQTSIGPLSSNLSEYVVENLIPYSTYCFWLQAVYSKKDIVFDHKESDMLCDVITPSTGM